MARLARIAHALARTPLPSVIHGLRRGARRPGRGLILVYHRVAAEPHYLGLCVSPQRFEEQMLLLRTRARVIPLAQLVETLSAQEPLREDLAAITFDDGYRDNLEAALPILRRHGLPATVFVTVDFIDRRRVPLADRVWGAFGSLWRRHAKPEDWPAFGDPEIDQDVHRVLRGGGALEPLRGLGQRLLRTPWERVESFLEKLDEFAGAAPEGASRMLDWDGVRRLDGEGVEIGSHTLSHPVLSRIPPEWARDEILRSKQRIEAEIQREVRGFAFPIGRRIDFTDDHRRAIAESGYRYACTTERGPNLRGADRYALLRLGVGDYAAAILDLKLALSR